VKKNPAKVDIVVLLSSSIAIEQFNFGVVKDHDKPGNNRTLIWVTISAKNNWE